MSTIIKNGEIVTSVDTYNADILIVNDIIAAIGQNLNDADAETIDANGRMVIPGGIDPHVHLERFVGTTTSDDFLTGSRAAALGGTTTFIDFAKPNKSETLHYAYETWQKKAHNRTCTDYGFHLLLDEADDERLAEVPDLIAAGVTSVKMYLAYPGTLMIDDATLFRVMLAFKENGGLVLLHAENGSVIEVLRQMALKANKKAPRYHASTRPAILEGEAVHRAICIAEVANCPLYFVHISTRQGLQEVQKARDRGLPVLAETCPHYLILNETLYDSPGFEGAKYVLTPPLRSPEHQDALWLGIHTNDISVISSDHCPFFLKQKALGQDDFTKIPNGGPGIETRISLIYHAGVHGGRINKNEFVNLVSTQAAKIFGLFPRKGTIAVGSDADLVIFDPDREFQISAASQAMNVDYNMFEGMKVRGSVDDVLLRGKHIVRDRKYIGAPGDGRFIARQRFGH